MKQDTHLKSAFQVPHWITPSNARVRLNREIDDFVSRAAAVAAPGAALAHKVTAGLGKTATTLRAIARHGEALVGQGHVLFYVPTLELAERACEDFRRLASGLPCRVVRGRDALRPDDRKKAMCERAELAKAVAGFVPSVTQALCSSCRPVPLNVLSSAEGRQRSAYRVLVAQLPDRRTSR
ncbi:DEAD/DEAH box helicase family protein [Thioclava sp.]|uniref:DEAD/DEAH box helicase family protein n=1 Tax=Thioclava sp. TaxID=1933450 RepID=UPI003AA8A5DD